MIATKIFGVQRQTLYHPYKYCSCRCSNFYQGINFQINRRPKITLRYRGNVVIRAGGPSGGLGGGKPQREPEPVDTWQKALLVGIGYSWVVLMVILPFLNVFYQAFSKGIGPFIENIMEPDFLHAIKMTVLLSLVTIPINTLFGIGAAIFLSRNEFPGKTVLISMLDLPFSISPVVVGLMFVLLYGREGWFAPLIRQSGFEIVFAFPGMALATIFVTMPFIVREVMPILDQMGPAEEEAARTMGGNEWDVFVNVTLPNIKYGLLYGLVLTNARAMGEFGAISVISGNIIGQTQTLTLFVESAYKEYATEAAFSAAVLLSMLAMLTLFLKTLLERSSGSEQ
eukprot:TRINITY_DN3463_c0_g1_i1.p1 TRINITY_DN3463_c0_g1~~TRINITY_DN3463_c0_g1_i1.p1  ORF type:complete len:400 (+),score=37.77 TRINITY_DN3463_c0_g1_i1:182-1201(+)